MATQQDALERAQASAELARQAAEAAQAYAQLAADAASAAAHGFSGVDPIFFSFSI